MNAARLILVCLIYAVPAILLIDGSIMPGLIAAIMAGGIATVASAIRQGEADFLLTITRPAAILALVPAIWMLLQIVPVTAIGLSHPIWQSAEQALGYPISGSISIDPGATLVALGQYLSMVATALLAAAVAIDRDRAELILFALVAATAVIAAVVIAHDAGGFTLLGEHSAVRNQARACVALGIVVTVAAMIRTVERYETAGSRPERSPTVLMLTFVACSVALALCLIALALNATASLLFAAAYGVVTLLAVVAIRRLGLGLWGNIAIITTAGIVAIVAIGIRLAAQPIDLTLAFASNRPDALIATTQRMLADAPWTGTGAGTFAALLPIYRDAGDAVTFMPPTTTAAIAIELGRPLLWLIVICVGSGIVYLWRGALRRGRDSFYPAAGAGSLVLVLLWAFGGAGLLGMPVAICIAAIVGLGLAQCRSRTIQ